MLRVWGMIQCGLKSNSVQNSRLLPCQIPAFWADKLCIPFFEETGYLTFLVLPVLISEHIDLCASHTIGHGKFHCVTQILILVDEM